MMNELAREILIARTRRHFLRDSAMALGGVALALLDGPDGSAATGVTATSIRSCPSRRIFRRGAKKRDLPLDVGRAAAP